MKKQKSIIWRVADHKLNNHGSTLLTVIICIAFISILGSLMLSVTMTNLQMKLVESKSKKNFYSCEAVMEKIRTAAQEAASEAVKNVYETDVLQNYATYLTMNENDRNLEIQKKVIVEFLNIVCNADLSGGYDPVITQASTLGYPVSIHDEVNNTYHNYFFDTKAYLSQEENNMITWSVITCNTNPSDTIRLKDVKIEYQNQDYRTAIISDIVITLPKFSFKEGTEQVVYKMEQPFKQYVLVADGAITSDNMTGTTNIQGNVYSGFGISVSGQIPNTNLVNINGDTIVTRGNITVSDTASLNIGLELNSVIWANNLVTYTSEAYSSSGSTLPTNLTVNGISVIKDDLTLEGKNSNAVLNGAYLGYTGAHNSLGSSIIINGSGSSLDLSGLSDLILAGRAHVSVQDLALSKDADIMTGESVAFKSNQRAYLLPAIFITNILHNPITQEDLDEIGTPVVTIDDTSETISYNDYVADTSYKIAAKQTGDTVLRYYYLNFGTGLQADKYFKDFYTLYSDTLSNMMPFNLGDITLPDDPAAIHAVGNLMCYDSDSGLLQLTPGMSEDYYPAEEIETFNFTAADALIDSAIAGLTLNDAVYAPTVIKDKTVNSLGNMYSKISHLLSLDGTRVYDEVDATVATMLKLGGVNVILDNSVGLNTTAFTYNGFRGNVIFKETDASEQYFWIIDGNVTIDLPDNAADTTVFSGILIATGDITIRDKAQINGVLISTGERGSGKVTVGNNVIVKGRIITTGDIELGQNCTLGTDEITEADLNNIFDTEGTILGNVFKNTEMTVDYTIDTPASNLVDLTSMVSYENWRRIE